MIEYVLLFVGSVGLLRLTVPMTPVPVLAAAPAGTELVPMGATLLKIEVPLSEVCTRCESVICTAGMPVSPE
ncbi:hypothetical protein ABIE53_000089 [Burkholderia sp. OAS925]